MPHSKTGHDLADILRRHTSRGGKESWRELETSTGISRHTLRSRARRNRRPVAAKGVQYANVQPEELTLDEFAALARAAQRASDSVDPIITHETATLPGGGTFGVIFTSCYHLGSRYVNHAKFVDLLNEILKIPRLYWVALGDETEGMTGFFDVASAHEQALADPRVQRAMLAKVLDKLGAADKLLCGFASQHGSDWAKRKSGADPIKQLYLDRHIPYFDGQGYLKLKSDAQEYRLFMAHQLPGHSIYNKNHAQRRAGLYKAPNADLIVMGDKHSGALQRTALDTWDVMTGERPSIYQWYVQVGTAKTGPDPYTIKTWSPGVWDWPIMVFNTDRHDIAYAPDLQIAKLLLENW